MANLNRNYAANLRRKIQKQKEPGYFEQVPDSGITEEGRQWLIEHGLLYVADDGKTKTKKELTKENVEAAAQAQDDAMKRDEQRIKQAIGMQKRAVAQGKPEKGEKKKKNKRPQDIPTEANFDNSKRFGMKAGEHMKEIGLDPKSREDREKYKEIINNTIRDAEKIKKGFYTKQEPETLCYLKGEMVILTRTNGEIITAYSKTRDLKGHEPITERRWFKEMKTIFDEEE